MTIPSEFSYANEDEFTEKFIVPLLHWLGYGLVANYHGTTQNGKDLVFADRDRFGDTVFYGLQVKYVSSIGQKDAEDLIADCRQAFRNPFRHPRTGADESIAFFVAVNGGAISDQARQNFFNDAAQEGRRPHVRLLDGKQLLALRNFVATNNLSTVRGQLRGLLREVETNRHLRSVGALSSLPQDPGKPMPLERLRNNAVAAYLASPTLPETDIPLWGADKYWQATQAFNRLLDTMSQPGYGRQPHDRERFDKCKLEVSFGSNAYQPHLSKTLQRLDELFPL